MKNYSSIQVTKTTKDRIKALALTPNESYENILLRLLNVKLGNREIKYNIHDNKTGCSIVCIVDWGGDSKNMKFENEWGVGKFRFPHSFKGFSDDLWNEFQDKVSNAGDALFFNLQVLNVDESINFGDLVLTRLN